MKTIPLLIAVLLPAGALAQTAADSSAIEATAHNYIDGYYEGNAERMELALHADLAKRIVSPRGGRDEVQHMTAAQLIQITGMGGGSKTPISQRRNEMRILDIFGNAAVVRVDASDWVDYLQVAKVDDKWVIINVLWAWRPEALERMTRQR